MGPKSAVEEDLNWIQIVSPALSPVYNNNPGYGLLTLTEDTNKIDDFKSRFLNLPDYHRFGIHVYSEYSLKSVYGDLNDALNIRTYDESLLYNYQKAIKTIMLGSGVKAVISQGA